MRILITGGAGFIGSNLALKLQGKGYDVVVMDNLSEQIHGPDPEWTSPLFRSIKDKIEFHRGDVTSRSDWEKMLKGAQLIVHLAAETGTGQSMYEIEKYTNVNVGGTALMLDILANSTHRVEKVLVVSSRSVYGEGKYFSNELGIVYPEHRKSEEMSQGDFEVHYPGSSSPLKLMPTDEASVIHPSSVYGINKQTQEQMVMCVCKSLGLDAVALRYQNVYGPGQSLQNPYTGILSIFSTLIKTGQPINVFEDGKQVRDFVFIDDALEATVRAIENNTANGEIFNVGSGVPTTVLTVARTLVEQFGTNTTINITGNFRLGDIRHNFADLTKISSHLGFQPAYDLKTGINSFVSWVNRQEVLVSKFEDSFIEMKNKGLLK